MKKTNGKHKFIIIFITFMAAIGSLAIISSHEMKKIQKRYHEEIQSYVQSDLTYENSKIEEQLVKMEEWTSNSWVADSDRGILFERISNIYRFKNDTINYYKNLGYALYYLQKHGNISTAANIYADLANYYLNNNSDKRAQEMIDRISKITDISSIEDLQVRSYVYRMQAILLDRSGEFDSALEQIKLSDQCLDEVQNGYYVEAYQSMNDMVKAEIFFNMCEYEKTEELLNKYKDSPLFEQSVYRDIMARDFIIPYYTVDAKYLIYTDSADTMDTINQYCSYCEEYGYRKIELKTLMYLKKNHPSKNQEENDMIDDKIDESYLFITDMQSEEYSLLIDDQLQTAIEEKDTYEKTEQFMIERRNKIILASIAFVLIIMISLLVILRSSIDSLTQIKNRRALNTSMKWNKMLNKPFSIIMFDIDNFKKVNDTYGHTEGDKVLQKIGIILLRNKERKIRFYRYGGEEFVILIEKSYIGRVLAFAEHIRNQVETESWNYDQNITVSMGISFDRLSDDAVKEADENLYYSKKNGKNNITYMENDKKSLFKRPTQ